MKGCFFAFFSLEEKTKILVYAYAYVYLFTLLTGKVEGRASAWVGPVVGEQTPYAHH